MGNFNNSNCFCSRCNVESFVSIQPANIQEKLEKNQFENSRLGFHNIQTPSLYHSQRISMEFQMNFTPKKLVKFPKIKNMKVLETLAQKGIYNTSELNIPNNFKKEFESIPHLGPLQLENGSVYEGQWQNGLRHGQGRQIWQNGALYEGFWLNDSASLYGRLIHSDGDVYQGSWAKNKSNGHGTYWHYDGTIYQGNWVDDNQHGFGIETWPNGSFFEGNFEFGKKNGKGTFKWADGYNIILIIYFIKFLKKINL